MDVTALLNSSNAEVVGRKESISPSRLDAALASIENKSPTSSVSSAESTPHVVNSESRTPSRSRTPWDAGGYSLPLTSDSNLIRTSSLPRIPHEHESPTDQPNSVDFKGASPQHKFSDSRSSLSSYTPSSTASVSHSRISSLSTVGEDQPYDTTSSSEISPLKTKLPADLGSDLFRIDKEQTSSTRPIPPISALQSFIQEVSDTRSRRHHFSISQRPQSPSDAVLFTRVQAPDKIDTSLQGHKRAASAPNFKVMTSHGVAPAANIGPILEPSPGESNESVSPRTSQGPSAATTPPTDAGVQDPSQLEGSEEPQEAELKCLFQTNCDLQAPLRKAISHIFGRNKTSTRQVPNDLWVYLCRKHYQRSRYRNATEYARLQCELVQTQIDRIMAWSHENAQNGISTGVVKDWSLGIRKREAERLKGKKGNGRKRALQDGSEEDQDDEDDDDATDTAELNGTAVPEWLLQRVGDGYSAEEIRDVMKLIQDALDAGTLKLIPDIEVLINFVEEISEKKTAKRRNVNGQAHKRSQSVGVGMSRNAQPMDRRPSHPGFSQRDTHLAESRHDHHQRVRGSGDLGQHYPALIHPPERQNPERRLQPFGSRLQIPHRPAFNNIQEHQTQNNFTAPSPQSLFSGFQGFGQPQQSFGAMAANSQRRASIAMTHHHDTLPARRPALHQRSQSEFGAPYQLPTGFTPASTAGYSPMNSTPYDHRSYQTPSTFAQMPASIQGPSSAMHGTRRYYDGMPIEEPNARALPNHARLPQVPESSSGSMLYPGRNFLPPVVPHFGNNSFTYSTGTQQNTNELPPISHHQSPLEAPHATPPQPIQPRTIQETDRTREIFSSRR